MDLISKIMEFESGELDDEGIDELFQHLVNTGMAWSLQGFYGRTARDLIEAGRITMPGAKPGTTVKVGINPIHIPEEA